MAVSVRMGSHIPIASVGIPNRRTVREARYAPCHVACSLPGIRHRRGLAAAIVIAPSPSGTGPGRLDADGEERR